MLEQTIGIAGAANPPRPVDRLAWVMLQVFPRLLGALLIYTGIVKLRGHAAMLAVLQFDHVPAVLLEPTAWALAGLELGLGVLLLSFIGFRRATLMAAIVLLGVYSIQLMYLIFSNGAPTCGCIDEITYYEGARRANLLSLGRNVCLLLPAFWTWLQLPASPTNAQRIGFPID